MPPDLPLFADEIKSAEERPIRAMGDSPGFLLELDRRLQSSGVPAARGLNLGVAVLPVDLYDGVWQLLISEYLEWSLPVEHVPSARIAFQKYDLCGFKLKIPGLYVPKAAGQIPGFQSRPNNTIRLSAWDAWLKTLSGDNRYRVRKDYYRCPRSGWRYELWHRRSIGFGPLFEAQIVRLNETYWGIDDWLMKVYPIFLNTVMDVFSVKYHAIIKENGELVSCTADLVCPGDPTRVYYLQTFFGQESGAGLTALAYAVHAAAEEGIEQYCLAWGCDQYKSRYQPDPMLREYTYGVEEG
jgi:hypothetical protein